MARSCTTAQYFTIGAAAALQLTGNMSMMCWVKGTNTAMGTLLGFYASGTDFTGYGVRIDGTNGDIAYWSNGVGSWQIANTLLNDGLWHAIGITISGTGAGAGTFWVGGSSAGTWTHTAPGAFSGNKAIGATDVGSLVLGYTLAELAIWNVALSGSDITNYVNGVLSSSIQSGNLQAYWRFLGDNSPEPDSGPNGYSATLVGTPTKVDHPPVYLVKIPSIMGHRRSQGMS